MTYPDRIRIGTRGSALARWQAEHVARLLQGLPGAPKTELVLIKTEGDLIQDTPLSKVQGKAFFTKEIEQALLDERVDLAVHSLKDLATQMPSGLALGAVLEREDPRDALVLPLSGEPRGSGPESPGDGTMLDRLPPGARVGTSSLRRRALLARWRTDLDLVDLRGNVPTRVRKLDEGGYDAIVLAAAGLKRLELDHRISSCLPPHRFIPAVSQGAVAVQVREGNDGVLPWIRQMDHSETRVTTMAERAFLRRLEGGCQVPVGAYCEVDRDVLVLRGIVASPDGGEAVDGEGRASRDDPEKLGLALAEELLGKGGDRILARIRADGLGI
jgi:hydroxymethylbilane synthase